MGPWPAAIIPQLRWYRWYQCRLRLLLACLLICSIGGGLLFSWIWSEKRQFEAEMVAQGVAGDVSLRYSSKSQWDADDDLLRNRGDYQGDCAILGSLV